MRVFFNAVRIVSYAVLIVFFVFNNLFAQSIDLSKATIVTSSSIQSPMRETYVKMLIEEVERRTGRKLKASDNWPAGNNVIIALVLSEDEQLANQPVPRRIGKANPENKKEGFHLFSVGKSGAEIVWIMGHDARGVLFGIGQLLRNAGMHRGGMVLDKNIDFASSPAYPIRGHQLGYRNTANSWDAWSVDQYEQYIRELALFGTNAIENIPFQDGPPGYHMKIPREEMNLKMSEICNNYDLDYWVWTPADVDLSDEVKLKAEVQKHAEFYKRCPRLDGVFFPGGDPGNNHPKYVMHFLKEIAAELHKYHPQAGIWISLQGFDDEMVDYFYQYLEENNPDWLTGVVSGPGSPDLAQTRFRLPAKYKHRHYPDITHNVRCQYPVENWDQAYALTLGREASNPMPFYYAKIHNRYAPFTDGFISYSDGVHDDVNKVVWSQMGWYPDKSVQQVLEEYCRFFFGNDVAEDAASGILGLERNWAGPLEENGGVETTFAFWQNLEKQHPELRNNWRWQLLVMRAYYDTYTRRRKLYEQELEKQAYNILDESLDIGADEAMKHALVVVNQADTKPIAQDLRAKISQYCEALFQSIGLQTSVPKYHASGYERGCILDFVDYPLNNRWWLEDEFKKIGSMPTEKEKLARLKVIRTWSNPGPGSFYDNISNISQSPHVQTSSYDATDVAWWDNGVSRKRLSTQLFQNNPKLVYEDLDPNARYIIRVCGYGDALIRVDGERLEPSLYHKELEGFKEFHLARKYICDGKIEITFDEPEESQLNWRKHSKVSDVWVLRQ